MVSPKQYLALLLFGLAFVLLALGIGAYYNYLLDYYTIPFLQETVVLAFLPFSFLAALVISLLVYFRYKQRYKVGIFWHFLPFMFGYLLALMMLGLEPKLFYIVDLHYFERWNLLLNQANQMWNIGASPEAMGWIVYLSYGVLLTLITLPIALLTMRIFIASVVGGLVITILISLFTLYIGWIVPTYQILAI